MIGSHTSDICRSTHRQRNRDHTDTVFVHTHRLNDDSLKTQQQCTTARQARAFLRSGCVRTPCSQGRQPLINHRHDPESATPGPHQAGRAVKRVSCGFRNPNNSARRTQFHCTRKRRAATQTHHSLPSQRRRACLTHVQTWPSPSLFTTKWSVRARRDSWRFQPQCMSIDTPPRHPGVGLCRRA